MPGSLGPICAFLSSITWAIGSTGYSRLSRSHSAFAVTFSRALVALPLFFLACFVTLGGWNEVAHAFGTVRASHLGWFALSMISSYGLGDVLFLWSTRYLGVPGALAISSAYPLWTSVGGYFFQGEVLSGLQISGLILAVLGVGVVILNGPKTPQDSPGESKLGLGVALATACSVFWAINSFACSQGGRDLPAAVANVIRMSFALFLSAGMSRLLLAVQGKPLSSEPFSMPFSVIRKWFWLFCIEAFGGSYFFVYGLSHSPLAVGSTLASLAPVISVPVAWFAGLEKFSLFRTVGVCAVVVGIWLLMGGF